MLHPDDPPFYVGTVPAIASVSALCTPRRVYLTYERYTHIVERRSMQGGVPVGLILHRLPFVIASPRYVGALTGDPRRVELYGSAPGDPVGVCVSLKCLEGATWVNTAMPVGRRTLAKYLRAGRLWPA